MRMLIYICILALLWFAPVERLDVAKLEPVQTVAVSIAEGEVVIETDTMNRGQGSSVESAVTDLESNTPGVIYLDTAQYLLITEEAVGCLKVLERYVSPRIRVSLWDGKGSVKTAAEFLEVRGDLPRLKDWESPETAE